MITQLVLKQVLERDSHVKIYTSPAAYKRHMDAEPSEDNVKESTVALSNGKSLTGFQVQVGDPEVYTLKQMDIRYTMHQTTHDPNGIKLGVKSAFQKRVESEDLKIDSKASKSSIMTAREEKVRAAAAVTAAYALGNGSSASAPTVVGIDLDDEMPDIGGFAGTPKVTNKRGRETTSGGKKPGMAGLKDSMDDLYLQIHAVYSDLPDWDDKLSQMELNKHKNNIKSEIVKATKASEWSSKRKLEELLVEFDDFKSFVKATKEYQLESPVKRHQEVYVKLFEKMMANASVRDHVAPEMIVGYILAESNKFIDDGKRDEALNLKYFDKLPGKCDSAALQGHESKVVSTVLSILLDSLAKLGTTTTASALEVAEFLKRVVAKCSGPSATANCDMMLKICTCTPGSALTLETPLNELVKQKDDDIFAAFCQHEIGRALIAVAEVKNTEMMEEQSSNVKVNNVTAQMTAWSSEEQKALIAQNPMEQWRAQQEVFVEARELLSSGDSTHSTMMALRTSFLSSMDVFATGTSQYVSGL